MDSPAARPRHPARRPRVQPPRGRAARRLRPAALLALTALAACGKKEPEAPREDYRARFLEQRWDGVATFVAAHLVEDLQAYVDGEDPAFRTDDPRYWALHRFLYERRAPPAPLRALYAPWPPADEVELRHLKRDKIALAVVTSFIRRVVEHPDEPGRARLLDAVAEAGVSFGFERAYGDSYTQTGQEVTDLFSQEILPVDGDSVAALRNWMEPLLAKWRDRVTLRSSSVMFGILLQHLGAEGGDRLLREWERMEESERHDLLRRLVDVDVRVGPAGRRVVVDAVEDPSLDVREAAFDVLEAYGAPLGELDASARPADLEAKLPELRAWAAKTES